MQKIRTFESLKNRHFCLYMGGTLCQMAGMNMQMMAGQLLIYRLTDSATVLGAISLVMSVPMLFCSLFGGVIADRVPKKYILMIGMFLLAILAIGIGVILSLGYLGPDKPNSWWILMASAFIQGIIMGLTTPAQQSIIPEIVGEERLMNALSLNNLGTSLFRILGPALAGIIIDRMGFQAVYYIMTVTNLGAIIFIAFVPSAGRMATAGSNALADIKDGINYIKKQKTILIILVYSLLFILFTMPFVNLMPIFADDVLGVGATGMGILLAIDGAGAGIAALILASLPNKKRGAMFLISGIFMGLVLTGFAFSGNWYLSMGLVLFTGIAQTGNATLSNTIIQYYVDPRYRGRVMSILMMSFGLISLGTFFTAVLADHIGVQWAVGGLAIVLTVVATAALFLLRQVRKLD
jgi:MFS family permease